MKAITTVTPPPEQTFGLQCKKRCLMNSGKIGIIALGFLALVSTVSAQQSLIYPTPAAPDAVQTVASFAILFLFILVYTSWALIPGIIATMRKHHNALSIWMIAIFAGWTGIGWIVALVWACTGPAPAAAPNPVVLVNR